MTRRRVRIRLEDPALPLLEQRRIRGRSIALDEASLATVEMLDARERAAGGRWREAHTLAPGEVVIVDERLT